MIARGFVQLNMLAVWLRWGALPVAIAGVCACGPERDLDLVPPRVLQVEPRGPLVGVDTSFLVRFSEPMNPLTINEQSIALVPRDQVSISFLADFENPPLSVTRVSQLVPVDIQLSVDELELRVVPIAPLLARTAYSLLLSADVRDQSGNPLADSSGSKATFRLDLTTDDGPPILIATDVVTPTTPLVPPNRKRFGVFFNQPIRSLTTQNIRIEALDGQSDPAVAILDVEPDRTSATLVLADADEGCFRLAPAKEYEFVVGPGITDDEGEEMDSVRIPFSTSEACDEELNRVVGTPLVIAGDVAASVRFDTTKPSSTEIRFGVAGGDLDCLGLPCPLRGASSSIPSPNVSPPRFVHSVDIPGLEVDISYDFQVRAEDWVGSVAVANGTFATAPLPKVVLSELLADSPAGITPDANGEFIELYNDGDEPIDLSGFAITLDGGENAGGSTCELPTDGTAPTLQPGAFLVITNENFVAEAYGIFDPTLIYRVSGGYLCGRGLANDGQSVGIIDGDGRPLSSFAGFPLLKPREGRSVERIAPDAPDVEASFCYSRTDTGPTPGAENGVRVSGCE